MTKVYNKEEAQGWFLNHSSGLVICVYGDKEFEASSYPEASEFFRKAKIDSIGVSLTMITTQKIKGYQKTINDSTELTIKYDGQTMILKGDQVEYLRDWCIDAFHLRYR